MAKQQRRDDVKTQTVAYKIADPEIKTQDVEVVSAKPKLKFTISPVRVNFALIRPTNFFRHGARKIEMSITGRNICRMCGGECKVESSPTFHSSDGNPKRIQKIKCQACGATDKVIHSIGTPYELLTPSAKDSPLASVMLHVAALAEKMPTFTEAEQQHISDELESKLREFIQPV